MSSPKNPPAKEQDVLFLPREFGGLRPDGHVLDIGCGKGRMAQALTGYLSEEGGYEGFDIDPERIATCKERVGPEHSNFHFHLIDIFNKRYNPNGSVNAEEYRFPYDDERFDLAMLFSVFTHMMPEGVEHYISEIARVLKRGGRMLATYFLLNNESLALLEKREGGLDLDHDFGFYRLRRTDIPEAVVAYREDHIIGLYERYGLRLARPIAYSNWATKKQRPWGQDVIVAEKT